MDILIIGGSFALFFFTGLIVLWKNIKFVKSAIRTTGEIVDVWDYRSTSNRRMYSSRIGFQTLKHEGIVFENPSSSTIKPKLGKEVVVYYKEEEPAKAKLGSIFTLYFIPALLMAMGVACLLIIVSMSNR